MKKVDTRVQYTRKVLREAILKLLEEKSIDRVTVKEICETAGLNRGTFYLHYDSPASLLKDVKEQFIADNMKYFASYWDTEREQGFMEQLFACLSENKTVCRVLMSSNSDPQFLKDMTVLAQGSTLKEWAKEFPDLSEENLEFVFDFVFSGVTTLISRWLSDEISLTPKELAHRIERLGHHALVAVREF